MAKPPAYRLQVLLELRERKKKAAEQHLASCLKKLKAEQERLLKMQQELERLEAKHKARKREYLEQVMRGELSAQDARTTHTYLEVLQEQINEQQQTIEQQRKVIEKHQEKVKQARAQLMQAAQELKAIEKNKEKWAEMIKKEKQAREAEVMDEIAQTIYLDKSKK